MKIPFDSKIMDSVLLQIPGYVDIDSQGEWIFSAKDEQCDIFFSFPENKEPENITYNGEPVEVELTISQKAKKEDRAMKDIGRLKKEVEQLYEITDTAMVCKLPGGPGCAFLTLDHNEKVKRAIFDMFRAGDKVKVTIRKEG